MRFLTILKLFALYLFLIIVLAPEWPAFQAEEHRLNSLIGLGRFDFVVWEAEAIQSKLSATVTAGHTYLSETARKELVLAYVEIVGQVRSLTQAINAVYADPTVSDPAGASADLQSQLADKRAEMNRLQPTAEAILQEQVSAILVEQGFDFFQLSWPPVAMHMTPLPYVLIVSPRDHVEQIYNIPLHHGLTIPEQERLEEAIFEQLNLSALVVPIGGLGIYPSMIIETSNLNFLADVIAHEWAHHWLTLHPLGIRYGASPEMRTINETIASLFGTEVGAFVIGRYYPELIPQPAPAGPPPPADPNAPLPFDFRAEMAESRITADQLLADGQIMAAEAYLEARRRYFVSNGYNIRRLNQAYFAFYGAYADTPGATGSDPIGPAIVALRQANPSLFTFMEQAAQITSLEQLQKMGH